jgi:hypothetical protein
MYCETKVNKSHFFLSSTLWAVTAFLFGRAVSFKVNLLRCLVVYFVNFVWMPAYYKLSNCSLRPSFFVCFWLYMYKLLCQIKKMNVRCMWSLRELNPWWCIDVTSVKLVHTEQHTSEVIFLIYGYSSQCWEVFRNVKYIQCREDNIQDMLKAAEQAVKCTTGLQLATCRDMQSAECCVAELSNPWFLKSL